MLHIGISSCFFYPDPQRLTFGPKTLCYLENDMARYVTRPDVIPVLIPDLAKDDIRRLVKQLDGLVLQGGADLAPESYGETPILDGRWKGDRHRDAYEMELVKCFLDEGKPVLGICRGFQLMNAYFGGTLYQDIATQRPDSLQHRDAVVYDSVNHGVKWVDGSFMQHLYANEASDRVNSVHHQGVKDLGKGLIVQAHCAEDGMIEAFIHEGFEPGKVMGVQWHPEYSHTLGSKVIDPDVLLRRFLEFAS
ncbi:MAG: gamma-glutamyl-gamma-aminobutyrate hydrolase family protein [Flavobacteriales bacterium]|nr:gamma-glutamyl-gamma-aminobutyrate hydrolase family protein [Flavobacteriales bacterium]